MHRSTVWRHQNKERSREYYRDYYAKNKATLLEDKARWLAERPEYKLWHSARMRARRKGLDFDIEISDITIPEVCPYLGIPMQSPSLDRVDNSMGYVKGNVEVISLQANRMKNNATREQLVAFAKRILSEDR